MPDPVQGKAFNGHGVYLVFRAVEVSLFDDDVKTQIGYGGSGADRKIGIYADGIALLDIGIVILECHIEIYGASRAVEDMRCDGFPCFRAERLTVKVREDVNDIPDDGIVCFGKQMFPNNF